MAKIQLNALQRIAAYHLAILWGQAKKAGGAHARRLQRLVDRLRIEDLEKEDNEELAKPETERKRRWHSDRQEDFELDEADMEFFRSLMREYFDKQEGLPDYFQNASPSWRVMLGLMESVDAVYGGTRLKAVE